MYPRRLVRWLLSSLCLSPLAAAERAIELEAVVAAPVAEVWRAWTTTEGVRTFFAPDARVELRVDGPYEVYFNPLAAPGSRGADDMRILAFQEEKMLAFTWNAPPQFPAIRRQRTRVLLRFAAEGAAATRLTLRHDGWGDGAEWDAGHDYFAKVWPNVLKNLTKRFTDGPMDWAEWMGQLRSYLAANPAAATAGGTLATDAEKAVRAVAAEIIDADNARDIERVMACYDEDLVNLPPTGGLIRGKAEQRRRYEPLFAEHELALRSEVHEAVVAGDHAWLRGTIRGEVRARSGGAARQVADNFLMVLIRRPEGWKIRRLMWTPEETTVP